MSNNLTLYGDISINGNDVSDVGKYKNMIGYVMQDDLMLPTFSPRETFMFVANMRLPNKS